MSKNSWYRQGRGSDFNPILLWEAFGYFRSDDLEDGLRLSNDVINDVYGKFEKRGRRSGYISVISGSCAGFFLLVSFALGQSKCSSLWFLVAMILAGAAIAPYLFQRHFQYGPGIPEEPLDLPHASDPHFEQFLTHLQRADGPLVYCRARFGQKWVALNRRQFFGRLRYVSFSEHGSKRSLALRYPTASPFHADLYVHRADLDQLIALASPKRKGGPGRNVKYAYVEAVFDLRADPRFEKLDLSDDAAALSSITDWLTEWFDSAANVSGDIPKREQLTPYGQKIFDHLKESAARSRN